MSELKGKIDAELSALKFDASKLNKENNAARPFIMLPKPVIALVIIFILFLCPMGVFAGINYIQKRMENMPSFEKHEIQDAIDNGGVMSFSRNLSEDEKSRMAKLKKRYESEGLYPGKTLTVIKYDEKADKDSVSFDIDLGRFFLPQRELTDEELLEIIDYSNKIDYVQGENSKAAQKRLNEKGKKLNNALTDDEAEKIAKETIERTYSVDLSKYSEIQDKNTYSFSNENGKDSLETVIFYTFTKGNNAYSTSVNITTGEEINLIWNADESISIDDIDKDTVYSKKDVKKLKKQARKLALNFSGSKSFNDEKVYVIKSKDGKLSEGSIDFWYYSGDELIEIAYNENIGRFVKVEKITSKKEVDSEFDFYKKWAEDNSGTVEEW